MRVIESNWKESARKDDELWYQTRPLRPGEQPENHTPHQRKPGIGRAEGTVTFKESGK